jgi:transcriptional regulator with XRE-family HTH domain
MTTFKRDFSFNQDIIGVVARNVRKYRKMADAFSCGLLTLLISSPITQEQLAIDIGVSNDFLRRFETTFGKEGMSLNTLYKISIVLNIPMDKFFIE